VEVIFGSKVTRKTPGVFSTRLLNRGDQVTINLSFKHSPDEALRHRSFEPGPRRRQSFAARRTRGRCFPPGGGLSILTVGLHHHAALFRRLVIELARNRAFLGSRKLKLRATTCEHERCSHSVNTVSPVEEGQCCGISRVITPG
jgi:hypothetical protein